MNNNINQKSYIYLQNEICEFIPLTPIDYTIKKNIIVTSLFKMSSGGYKNFNKYLDGIKILSDVAKKYNMSVRIFIDHTIHDDNIIMKYLNKFNNITLILYKCNSFLVNKHHVGVFGTLVRFFPLFDFPNNDSNIVLLADADTKYYQVRYIHFINSNIDDIIVSSIKYKNPLNIL